MFFFARVKWDLQYIDPHRKAKDRTSITEEDLVNSLVEINKARTVLEKVWDSRRCSELKRRIKEHIADCETYDRRISDIQHEINGKVTEPPKYQ